MPSSETCEHCRGTGQPNGIMGGPQHGLCSYCGGSGLAHPAPTAADTPYDPTTQPYDEPFRHVAADTAGLVERLTAENRVLSAELNDACETGRERRDLAYIERKRAEAAEQQLAAAREQRAEFEEHWAALFDTKKAELAAAREQIAELEHERDSWKAEWNTEDGLYPADHEAAEGCGLMSSEIEQLRAENKRLREALEAARKMVQTRETVDEIGWGKGSSPATRLLATIDAALTPLPEGGQ